MFFILRGSIKNLNLQKKYFLKILGGSVETAEVKKIRISLQ